MKEYKVIVKGMVCSGCANNVINALKKIDGVLHVDVNLITKEVIIRADKDVKIEEIKEKINKAGYDLEEQREKEGGSSKKKYIVYNRNKINLLLSIFIIVIVLINMVFHSLLNKVLPQNFVLYQLIFSFIIIFILGWGIFKRAIFSFKSFSFNMDTLITIGIVSSLFTGILKILGVDIEDFTLIGVMIVAISNIGNYIKDKAVIESGKELESIVEDYNNKKCSLIKDDKIIETRIRELKVGDILIVKPGETIPSDGTIIEGETFVDESIITGESAPVFKKVGDKVIGFSINKNGLIKIKTEKTGEETFISSIIGLIKKASLSKVSTQVLADKISSIFVQIILIVSILSFVSSYFLYNEIVKIISNLKNILPFIYIPDNNFSFAVFSMIATLVIACPCALSLATPTALMVGFGLAYKNKILVKNPGIVEKISKISTIVFDKTGTLTTGDMYVIDYYAFDDDFIELSYTIEKNSNHPISKTIIDFIKDKIKDKPENIFLLDSFEYKEGKGIIARINKKLFFSGNINFLKENGIVVPESYGEIITKFLKEGKSITGIGSNNRLVGFFVIEERLREESYYTVRKLKGLGLRTVLLSGDNEIKTAYIANKLGIDEYFGNLLPAEKIEKIKEIQSNGERVIMIGDGINDAPALKQADVSIAIGKIDIAASSSDIVLLEDNLFDSYKAIFILKKTLSKIKINIFWSFFYNMTFIPLAFIGIIHPIIGEISMSFSSVSVVLNSLSLKRIKLK